MIYFSIVEFCSKFIGIFILGFIARSLDFQSFAEYSFALLLFGIFFDFSNFGYQEKHLSEYSLSKNYIGSSLFLFRQCMVLFLSTTCFFIFVCLNYFYFNVNVFPLAIIFLMAFLNIEFIFYGASKSCYLIVSRFISQLVLLASLFFSYYFDNINDFNVMFFQLLNSFSLCLLILYFSARKKLYSLLFFYTKVSFSHFAFKDFFKEFISQFTIFSSKLLVVFVVSIEIILLFLCNEKTYETISVSYRVSLIFLPFIIFYLSVNFKNLSKFDIIYKSFSVSVITCFTVFFSSTIIYVLLGAKYASQSLEYSAFFFLITYQFILSYSFYFYLNSKAGFKDFNRIWLLIALYTFLIFILNKFIEFNLDILLTMICLKVFITIILLNQFSVKTKVCLIAISYTPIGLYFIMCIFSSLELPSNYLISFFISMFGEVF